MPSLKPRALLAETVRQLLPVHDRLKLPRKAYDTTLAWWEAEGKSTGAKLTPLDPAKPIRRREPKSLEAEPHWIFERDREDKNWETFVLELEGGRITRDDAVVLTPDRAILGDVSREPNRKPKDHTLFRPWRLPPLERVGGTVAVLAVVGGKRYYHWLLDLIPRLGLLERAGYDLRKIDKFVVNDFTEPFQKETLAHFGIEADRLILPTYSMHLRADRLLVPSLAGTSGNPLKSTYAFLRAHLERPRGAVFNCFVRDQSPANGAKSKSVAGAEETSIEESRWRETSDERSAAFRWHVIRLKNRMQLADGAG